MRKVFGPLLAAALIGLLPATQVTAATPGAGTLKNPSQVITWTGHFDAPAGGVNPLVVGNETDNFTVDIQLPANVWHKPGGVQFGIRFPYDPGNNDLDLRVFNEAGDEIASSASGDENAESVIIPSLANGKYRVEVEAFTANNGIDYDGLIEIERLPKAEPPRDLLPNLISLPQRNVTLEDTETGNCQLEEFLEQGSRRCLRFDQIIGNDGTGPLEIRYELQGVATDQSLVQRIYRSDGTFRERQADRYEFHAAHAHFHYKNFAISNLYQSDSLGTKLSSEPIRSGRKNGFCLIDVENFKFGQKGDAGRTYVSCFPDGEETVVNTSQTNGISAGWGDVYNYYLPDQYIEVTGVEDGYYLLETKADAGAGDTGTIVERNETDNTVSVLIQICGAGAGIVGTAGNPCSS